MTLRKFRKWCNDRACDGRWSKDEAKFCANFLASMSKLSFWKRHRVWNTLKFGVILGIVNPVDQRIREINKADNGGSE